MKLLSPCCPFRSVSFLTHGAKHFTVLGDRGHKHANSANAACPIDRISRSIQDTTTLHHRLRFSYHYSPSPRCDMCRFHHTHDVCS